MIETGTVETDEGETLVYMRVMNEQTDLRQIFDVEDARSLGMNMLEAVEEIDEGETDG